MLQVRIHGRGGQGVVTAAEMLAIAAIEQGRRAQAGADAAAERAGAPGVACCRIDDKDIVLRGPVVEPDAVIVLDPALLSQADVLHGLKADGCVLVNSRRSFDELGLADKTWRLRHERLCTVPATEIAIKHLGRPLPGVVLLGGFAALSGLVTLQAVTHAIGDRFAGPVAAAHMAGATEAYEFVRREIHELVRL